MATLQPLLLRVLESLCSTVGSTVSKEVLRLAKAGEFTGDKGLFSLKIDPSAYSTSYSYLRDASCVELLRKCRIDSIVSARTRARVAEDSFLESEAMCARSNARLRGVLRNELPLGLSDLSVQDCLGRAKAYIAQCLGPVPTSLNCGFGPGATYGNKGHLTTIPDKIESRIELTSGSVFLAHPILSRTAWYRDLVNRQPLDGPYRFVRGNRFTTVPKTALKDRGICVEPSGNVYIQKGVGRAIKKRILFFTGQDLNHAQHRHRSMAREASRTGSHATIDLSSASDTVCLELVKFLLPGDWYELLSSLRSPATLFRGRWYRLEKFSSMGNGYTFELETLIFASLAYAVGCRNQGLDFSVFGDDIIVPTEFARDLCEILKWCGFSLNKEKTFLDGPFRESCGGDFFLGAPVRAHNLEDDPSTPEEWISLANGLRRLGLNDPGCDFRDSFPHTAWMRCLDALPSDIRRLRGPPSYGDLVINDETGYQMRVRGNGLRYLRVYRPVSKKLPFHHWKGGCLFAAALYGMSTAGVSTRGVSGYKVGWVNFP